MRRWVVFVLLATAVPCLSGQTRPPGTPGTVTAASCNRKDVEKAISAAKDGNTVVIPAGTCTWTSTLTIKNKILTLQGAGIDVTTIVENVDKSWPNTPQLLVWNTKDGGLSRMTGMTIEGGSVQDDNNSGTIKIEGGSHSFRFDHVRLHLTKTSGVFFLGSIWGVVDHNVFQVDGWITPIYAHNGSSWTGSGDFGDSSWAEASSLGTERALFIEDNVFSSGGLAPAIDGWMGSRVVFRHNTLTNTFFANHGTESSGRWRSQRQFEIYDNSITFNNPSANWASLIGIRGGTGVVFNNKGETSNGATTNLVADLTYLRRNDHTRCAVYEPWGCSDGKNPWDGNTDSSGYPTLDAPGRGQGALLNGFSPKPVGQTRQALEPIYGWNNTLNGMPSPLWSKADVVVEGRDFFNSEKPDYNPYQYPHPATAP